MNKLEKAEMASSPLRDNVARLSDRVAAEIEHGILVGDLRSGTQLPPEGELCTIFGVSRTVIRDAIRTVSARGLLDVRAGRGTTILSPSDDSFSEALLVLLVRSDLTTGDVMDARAAIESELVPLAATRSTPAQRREVVRELVRMENAIDAADWVETEDAHLAFHVSLMKATNLPAMQLMLKPMQRVIMLCSRSCLEATREDWASDAHQRICDALDMRDEGALRAAMRDHFAFLTQPEYAAEREAPFGSTDGVATMLLEPGARRAVAVDGDGSALAKLKQHQPLPVT